MLPGARKILMQVDILNKRSRLFAPRDHLLVAASGGPDSTALVALLSLLKRKYDFKVSVAHLDHGLAGSDAKDYRRAAENAARHFGFSFYSARADVRGYARRRGRSLEEAGRIQRYLFLEKTARRIRAGKVVTAHTLDDQAETMLMRILRGSGWKGLSGIPAKRPLGKIVVVRPFLLTRKKELLAFLKKNRLSFCYDKSNTDTVFTRNRVRADLLPYLEKKFNPRVREVLSSLQMVAAEAGEYLDAACAKAFKTCVTGPAGRRVRLDIQKLSRQPAALRTGLFFKAVETLKKDSKGLTFEHLAGLTDLLTAKGKHPQIHLPDGLRASKKGWILEISLGPG